MGTMSITPKAVEQLGVLMEKEGKTDHGLRITVGVGGCAGYRYNMMFEENPAENDEVIEVNGLKIFLDEESKGYLKGAELDFVESLEGSFFNVNNPNASSTCGCGQSFKA
ncbi:MAG: iron-sulfur cluster assembly accessory protein [Candidatus Hydrothermarchaeales archaeon]